MSKFNAGDRVKRIGASFQPLIKGNTYTVKSLTSSGNIFLHGYNGCYCREFFELVEDEDNREVLTYDD